MATFTYTPGYYAASTARYVHSGNISVSGTAIMPDSTTTVPSLGDVVYLCKIPDQAVIIDFEEDHTALDTATFDFGIVPGRGCDAGDETLSSLISAGAKSTVNRRDVLNHGHGVKVSISDSDPNGYGILGAVVRAGSMTTSITIRWTVVYRMDSDPMS